MLFWEWWECPVWYRTKGTEGTQQTEVRRAKTGGNRRRTDADHTDHTDYYYHTIVGITNCTVSKKNNT